MNLISLSYSAMTLLPYSDESFSGYQSASARETRYEIGQQIQSDIILCSFGRFLETIKNCPALIKAAEDCILSGFRKWFIRQYRKYMTGRDAQYQNSAGLQEFRVLLIING